MTSMPEKEERTVPVEWFEGLVVIANRVQINSGFERDAQIAHLLGYVESAKLIIKSNYE